MTTDNFEFNLAPGNIKGAMKAAGASSSDLWKVPPDKIHVIPGFNVRIEDEEYAAHVRFLADSIKANGFTSVLLGYVDGEKVVVIDGHSRLKAIAIAAAEGCRVEFVPVKMMPSGTDQIDLLTQISAANENKNLKPMERAILCKRMIGFGVDEDEIARRMGRSRALIDSLLTLLSAGREVGEMVQSGKVSATEAAKVVKKHGAAAAKVLDAASEAAGGGKVTNRHIDPKGAFAKKHAATMLDILRSIHASGGLNDGITDRINALMKDYPK